ncbi:hypothetical protein T492DRAFT_1068107 [Pavlovales sp. CCMP2436]|nr:hypothetical protein T492DRAFT_1068107 [Pavlovales sp. CCMP2436]
MLAAGLLQSVPAAACAAVADPAPTHSGGPSATGFGRRASTCDASAPFAPFATPFVTPTFALTPGDAHSPLTLPSAFGGAETEDDAKLGDGLFALRVACAFPGCGKLYSCGDGARKHAKRKHLGWLRALDAEKKRCCTPTHQEPGASKHRKRERGSPQLGSHSSPCPFSGPRSYSCSGSGSGAGVIAQLLTPLTPLSLPITLTALGSGPATPCAEFASPYAALALGPPPLLLPIVLPPSCFAFGSFHSPAAPGASSHSNVDSRFSTNLPSAVQDQLVWSQGFSPLPANSSQQRLQQHKAEEFSQKLRVNYLTQLAAVLSPSCREPGAPPALQHALAFEVAALSAGGTSMLNAAGVAHFAEGELERLFCNALSDGGATSNPTTTASTLPAYSEGEVLLSPMLPRTPASSQLASDPHEQPEVTVGALAGERHTAQASARLLPDILDRAPGPAIPGRAAAAQMPPLALDPWADGAASSLGPDFSGLRPGTAPRTFPNSAPPLEAEKAEAGERKTFAGEGDVAEAGELELGAGVEDLSADDSEHAADGRQWVEQLIVDIFCEQ